MGKRGELLNGCFNALQGRRCHCEDVRQSADDEAISLLRFQMIKTRLLGHFVPRNDIEDCGDGTVYSKYFSEL